MRSVEIVMRNPSGLHARPATLFTEAAAGFAAKVTVENLTRGKSPVDAKSMLMLLTAGVSKDHRIRLVADGPDEQKPVVLLDSHRTISSFGEDDDGELYLTDLGSGELYRVTGTPR